MKIIGIKFLNLNSLKGEHEIRFDQPPFSESGLFAITGPTGAGKTTILDAITLALYGQVPRHEKDHAAEIMTRHTSESYAEIEFEVKEITYRSKWSNYRAHKKATGKLQGVKMELSNITTDEIIEGNSLSRFHAKIIEICGLDYNQFLRSVILSQGDFTRFLKANENERSELLEKITDTSIYSKISIFTYDKTKQEKVQLDALQARLQDVTLLPEDERNSYIQSIAEITATEQTAKLEEKALKEKLDWLIKIQQLEIRRQELTIALQADEELYTSHVPEFDKLQLHRRALAYKPALAAISTIEELLTKTEKEISQYTGLLPELKTSAAKIVSELDPAKSSLLQSQEALSTTEPVFEMVFQKDAAISNARFQLAKTEDAFQLLQQNVEQAGKIQADVMRRLSSTNKKIIELGGWLYEHAQDASLDKELIQFDNGSKEINGLRLGIEEANTKLSQWAAQVNEDTKILEANQRNSASISKKTDLLIGKNNEANKELGEVLQTKTLDELEQTLGTLPSIIYTSEQQLRLVNFINQCKTAIQELQQQQVSGKAKHVGEEKKLILLKKDRSEASKKLNDLQQLYELEMKLQKYDADRDQLQAEKPCPLCGSIHHPYVHDNYKSHVSEAEGRRNEQIKLLEQLTGEADQAALAVNDLLNQLNAGEDKLNQFQKDLSATGKEFRENNLKLPAPLEMEKGEIIELVIKKKQRELAGLQATVKMTRDLQQLIAGNEMLISKHRELLAQSESKQEQAGIRISHAEKQIAAIHDDIQRLKEKKENIESELTLMLTRFGIVYDHSNNTGIVALVSERFEKYIAAANQLRTLQLEQVQLETEEKNINTDLAHKNRLLQQQAALVKQEVEQLRESEAERFKLFDVKDPNTERKRLNSNLEAARKKMELLQESLRRKQQQLSLAEDRIRNANEELTTLGKNLWHQLQNLQLTLQENNIASVAALKLLFVDDDVAKTIETLQKEAEQKIASGKNILAVTAKELHAEKENNLTTEPEEVLSAQIDLQGKTLSQLNQQIGKIKQQLEEDERLKLKHAELAEAIETQQKEFQRWNKLSVLIGSADGKKFSRFAQGLTLARLTDLANRHLQRLSDRYKIIKSPEKDLELQIQDGYQADVIRPMSTLSGGESFLVSLALALGLSDLASRRVQINSLFIDEGFGTLDADTLDIAISALENLQAGGKSIGIISHVEALKESIGTQVQVSKQPGGYSRITIRGYGNKIIEA